MKIEDFDIAFNDADLKICSKNRRLFGVPSVDLGKIKYSIGDLMPDTIRVDNEQIVKKKKKKKLIIATIILLIIEIYFLHLNISTNSGIFMTIISIFLILILGAPILIGISDTPEYKCYYIGEKGISQFSLKDIKDSKLKEVTILFRDIVDLQITESTVTRNYIKSEIHMDYYIKSNDNNIHLSYWVGSFSGIADKCEYFLCKVFLMQYALFKAVNNEDKDEI